MGLSCIIIAFFLFKLYCVIIIGVLITRFYHEVFQNWIFNQENINI